MGNEQIILLKCTSAYPSIDEVHLATMPQLGIDFDGCLACQITLGTLVQLLLLLLVRS